MSSSVTAMCEDLIRQNKGNNEVRWSEHQSKRDEVTEEDPCQEDVCEFTTCSLHHGGVVMASEDGRDEEGSEDPSQGEAHGADRPAALCPPGARGQAWFLPHTGHTASRPRGPGSMNENFYKRKSSGMARQTWCKGSGLVLAAHSTHCVSSSGGQAWFLPHTGHTASRPRGTESMNENFYKRNVRGQAWFLPHTGHTASRSRGPESMNENFYKRKSSGMARQNSCKGSGMPPSHTGHTASRPRGPGSMIVNFAQLYIYELEAFQGGVTSAVWSKS
ncbi:hypothetical protein J6590_053312 [Homalodisca vitripennis]|nr:hypothetical protein J6590_053312 [Homalodisca vitripennis]